MKKRSHLTSIAIALMLFIALPLFAQDIDSIGTVSGSIHAEINDPQFQYK